MGDRQVTDLTILQETAYNRFLLWKRITHLLNSYDFKTAWEHTVDRNSATTLVKQGNFKALKEWVADNLDPNDLSVRQLRERASKAQIPNYSRKSKDELIRLLSR